MKYKIITLFLAFYLLFGTQAEAQKKHKGGFWKGLGKFLGNVAEAAVVVGTDYAVNKYAPEQAAQYRESMQQLNEQSQKRADEDKNAWDEYKQGRKQELQRELMQVSDADSRARIRQDIAELDEASTSSPTNNNTSLAGSFLADIGIKQQNIQTGMAWNAAQDKYEKQSVITDYILDATGDISGNPALFEKFKQISDAQNTYLSEKSKAMSAEEKQAALNKRNLAYSNIGYDTYQEAQDRKSRYLAEKLQIQQQLIAKGWYNDSQLADEVAGSIIAVQKSNLSQGEKEEILRGYGFSESPQQIQQIVDEVTSVNYDSIAAQEQEAARIKAEQDAKRKAAEEEAKRQAEIQRQEAERKAAEERANAIQEIATAKIDGYALDKSSLSQTQKSTLDSIADILNKYSDINVLIVGYTCNIGSQNINLKIGLKRAEAGKKYLIEKGVAQERISVDSKGKTQPLVKNTSIENRRKNRRIEFVIE